MQNTYDILVALKKLYGKNSRVVEYELCATLFEMRLREKMSSNDHIIRMTNILRQLDIYGVIITDKVKVNLILQSLLNSYKSFITNYNMNRIKHMLLKLLNRIQEFYYQGKGHEEVNLLLLVRQKRNRRNPKKVQKLDPKKFSKMLKPI